MNTTRAIDAYWLEEQVLKSLNENHHSNPSIQFNHKCEHIHFLHLINSAPTLPDTDIKYGGIMTISERNRFNTLRQTVMRAIEKELEIDPYCKSYEGCFEIQMSYPTYFDDPDGTQEPEYYEIILHCYVVGPGRHYSWSGKTFSEALTKAEHGIKDMLSSGEYFDE